MRRDRKLLTLLGVLCLALAFAAPPAFAAYEELGSFAGNGIGPGGSGAEDGQLSNPNQAAVNDATGSLYVADTDNNRIQVFAPTASGGAYASQAPFTAPTGVAIDQASGDVYVANASGIAKLDPSLAPVAGWTDPGVTGPLAVDPTSGDLLVADTGANLIRRFEADGTAAGTFAAERPIAMAANSAGQVFVVTSSGDIYGCASSAVRRFSAAGVEEATIGGSLEAPGNVAVDPDSDAVVVAARVNSYNCGSSAPLLAFFDAAGTETGQLALAASTVYATVSGLAAQGGGSGRFYAVTRSPMNDSFGATKITAVLETKPEAPTISAQGATPRTTEATLRATIDRGNLATTYRFEYGPTPSYGQSTPAKSVAAGSADLQVTADVAGLQPGSTYHFRAVLSNGVGDATGPDQVFTTGVPPSQADPCPNAAIRAAQGSSFLPDCRAFEQVSPVAKNGNDIFRGLAQASVTGDGLAFTSAGAFGNAQSATAESFYVAFRGASGWATQGVMPITTTNYLSVQRAFQFTADLSATLVSSDYPADPDAVPNNKNLFRRDNLTGQFKLLSPRPNGVSGDGVANIFDGIGSADLTTYALMAEHPLRVGDPEPIGGKGYLIYKYSIGGELRLIANNANVGWGRATETAMSADGSRLFYTTPGENGDQKSYGSLYLSEGEDPPLEVSASQLPTPEPEHQVAQFFRATPDGSKVLFASTERLNEESNADGGAPVSDADLGDLYIYDVESGSLVDLSRSAPGGGEAMGVLGASTDLSKVYFVDRAVLASGGVPGSPNLYFWDSSAGVSYAGTLDPGEASTWTGVVTERQSQVSADGSAVVFQSRAAIGGDNPAGHVGVYYYRGGGSAPTCISCGSDGVAAADAQLVDRFFFNMSNHQARFVSDDGRRAFFTAAGALVGRDANGKLDVYQWDAAAARLSLLSSGQGDSDSIFVDASPSGDNAFFTTRDRLVGADTDTLVDAYVARVGGGFAEPPLGAAPCAGEGCKPPPSSAPSGLATGSSSYVGPGSGKARSRCVKKPARKRNAAKGKSKAKRQGANARGRASAKKKPGKQRKSCRGGRS